MIFHAKAQRKIRLEETIKEKVKHLTASLLGFNFWLFTYT
jgi:hypothetical protein